LEKELTRRRVTSETKNRRRKKEITAAAVEGGKGGARFLSGRDLPRRALLDHKPLRRKNGKGPYQGERKGENLLLSRRIQAIEKGDKKKIYPRQ